MLTVKVLPQESFWRTFWDSRTTAIVLLAIFAFASIWYFHNVPSPGISIGILGAAAGVMSLRPDMKPMEKVCWIAILIILVLGEFHAIGKNDDQNAHERAQQNEKLQALNDESTTISAGLKNSIEENQKQFAKTIKGIKATLESTNATLQQTKPSAYVQFTKFDFLVSPDTWGSGRPVLFESWFMNNGTDSASDIMKLGKFYLESNDAAGVGEAYKNFQTDWTHDKEGPSFLARGEERGALVKQDNFSRQGIAQIGTQKVVVFIFRAEYSDKNGRWGTLSCREIFNLGGVNELHCPSSNGMDYNNPKFKISAKKIHELKN